MAAGAVEVGITKVSAKTGILFDGTNDDVAIGTALTLAFSSGAASISFWLRLDGTGATRSILGNSTTNAQSYLAYNNGGKIVGETDTNTDAFSSSVFAVNDSKWHHFVVTGSSNTIKIYREGINITDDGTIADDLTIDKFGARMNDLWLKGVMADIIFWSSKELTAAEALLLYKGEIASGATSRWNFADGTYNDSIGSNNLTNNGTRIGIFDADLAVQIASDRVGANDKQLLAFDASGQVINVDIEE